MMLTFGCGGGDDVDCIIDIVVVRAMVAVLAGRG